MSTNRAPNFDTTFRDGDKSSQASMTCDERACLAEVLETLRADVTEAGLAMAAALSA